MKKIIYVIYITICTLIMIFFYNNTFLYEQTILKVKSVENNYSDTTEIYTQTIQGIVKNGDYINKEFELLNETSYSSVYDESINQGDFIFVKISADGSKIESITGIKRDYILVFMILIFITLLLIIGEEKGFKTIISLIINIILSISATIFYINQNANYNILFIFTPIIILSVTTSLLLVNGYNKKSISAIISTLLTLVVTFSLVCILINFFDKGLFYYTMDYVDVVKNYKSIFYLTILLSGLGAVMDIAITVSSSLNEIINKNPKVTHEELLKSGKNISKDITGTMINVLLYTCFISTIPTIILAIKNNIGFINAIDIYGQIQMVIILSSAIFVIISIPVSLKTSLHIFKRRQP